MLKIYKRYLYCVLLGGMALQASAQTAMLDSTKMLTEAPASMESRVDLGLRSEKAWRTTGAVFTISGEELTRMTAGNLLNTLQGRIPGLTVATGSGEPGYDNPTLYVRGQSSWNIGGNRVTILLDGFPVDLNGISSLSVFEIESVTLLKDAASLAIYGLESGAGLLSIRTKRGMNAGKTQISVNGRYGILSPIELPKVSNAFDYATAYNQATQNDGLPTKYKNPDLYKSANDPVHPNVDWYKQVLSKNSVIQDYNLAFRGGGPRARYYVFGNYTNFEGIYKNAAALNKDFGTNANYTKLNLRANVELQLSKNLSVRANIVGVTEDRNTPSGFTAANFFANLLRTPAAAFPVTNPDGSWGNNSVYNFNPQQLLQRNGVYNSHARTLQTNFAVTEHLDKIVKGLSFNGALSFSNLYIGTYVKSFTVPSFEIIKNANDSAVRDAAGNVTYKTIGAVSQGITDGGNEHWNRNTFQAGFDYANSFGKHTITGMVQARRQEYIHDGQVYAVRTQGLLSSVTYDYNQKYIADLSASYNGSADYQAGHRYGFFPAVGLGWVASNEDFLKGSKAVNFLKIRASYGLVGNQNEDYRFLYERWGVSGGNWIVGTGNTVVTGRREGAYANTDFRWEQKSIFNVGVDVKLWEKLTATVDVFNENRTGILETPAGVPDFTGFSVTQANTGKVNNKGLEAALNFHEKQKWFEYYVGGNIAFARNKITTRSEEIQPTSNLYTKGYRLGQFKGLINNGFYQQADFDATGNLLPNIPRSSFTTVKPGDLKFVDQDGNGIINDYDRMPIGFAKLPEITIGFNIGFKVKGFDFDAYAQGVMHRTISLLDDAYNYTHPLVNNNNITAFSTNSWTPQNAATATTPRLSTLSNENNNRASDFWLRNGNFLKIRSIEVGYTLPQTSFLKRVEAIRFFANGTNLFTWDNIEGLEAERMSMGYPLMKTVSFGVRAKF